MTHSQPRPPFITVATFLPSEMAHHGFFDHSRHGNYLPQACGPGRASDDSAYIMHALYGIGDDAERIFHRSGVT
jgi:hypothetical protein